jgi:type I restriction enzyme S subunit
MELMKGFKQTEVGAIPEDWQVSNLGGIGEGIIGLTYSPSDVKDYGTLVLRSSNVQNGQLTYDNNVYVDMELPQRVIVKENDILICVRNGSKQLIGKCALIDKNAVGKAFGAFMTIYRSSQNLYIIHQFRSNVIQKQINEVMGATINQITNKDLSSFKIPLPPSIKERDKIATTLSNIDALISQTEKLIDKKRNLKQGAMQKLLLPKEDWKMKKLGDLGTIVTGSTPPTQTKEYWNGSIPWITPTDIINNQKDIFQSEREITNTGLQVIRKLPANTLLVTCIASIGKNAILRNEGACNQQINAIIPNTENSVDYLYFLIENSKSYLIGKAGITATMMISKKEFKEITYSIPSFIEQIRIATILSDIDAEITALETKLEKYRRVKLGMMQNLLTGKIRLL